MTRGKPFNLLVGPMRPLVAGGAYDPGFHTYEALRAAGLGVDYSGLTLDSVDTFVPTLAPMVYEQATPEAKRNGRTQPCDAAREPRRRS